MSKLSKMTTLIKELFTRICIRILYFFQSMIEKNKIGIYE